MADDGGCCTGRRPLRPDRAGLAERGDPPGRGRREPVRRHPPARLPAAGPVGDRPLPQGRVGPPHRLAEAPPGPVAVPARPVQRVDQRGRHDHRGVVGIHRRLGGLLRPAARPALRRGHAAVHLAGEDRADRVPGRSLPPRGRPVLDLRRVAAARAGDRRPLPRPVHLRRARDRLARQQQHRRVDLQPARPRAAPDPDVGGRRRRHRAVRRRRSAGSSATAATTPGSASSTRRTPPSSGGGTRTTPPRPARAPGSRGSAGRGWSRRSCRRWSTA